MQWRHLLSIVNFAPPVMTSSIVNLCLVSRLHSSCNLPSWLPSRLVTCNVSHYSSNDKRKKANSRPIFVVFHPFERQRTQTLGSEMNFIPERSMYLIIPVRSKARCSIRCFYLRVARWINEYIYFFGHYLIQETRSVAKRSEVYKLRLLQEKVL